MRPRTDGHWRRNLFFPSLCSHWTFRAPQWVAGRRRRRRRRRAKKTFGVCSHAAVVVDFSIFGQPGKNFRPARTSNTNKRLGWFGFIRTHLAHRIRLFWDFWCQNSNRNPAGRSRTRFHLFPFRLPVSSRPSKPLPLFEDGCLFEWEKPIRNIPLQGTWIDNLRWRQPSPHPLRHWLSLCQLLAPDSTLSTNRLEETTRHWLRQTRDEDKKNAKTNQGAAFRIPPLPLTELCEKKEHQEPIKKYPLPEPSPPPPPTHMEFHEP